LKHDVESYFEENKPYDGLGRASLRSGVTFVAVRGINVFVQLASTILLARILGPHDFGLVAMILALIGFAPMLIDLGTSDAASQKTHISRVEISTLFWLNVVIGLLLALLLAASSRFIAVLFGEPSLTGISIVLSTTFVMAAVSTQHYALMRRAMQFRRIAMIDISSNLVGSIVSVAMALTDWGYWALVAKPIVTSGFAAVAVWTSCRWVPGRPQVTAEVKDLIRFGMGVTGFTMTDYLARSADRIAIGYFQGAGPLGYFQNAFAIYTNVMNIVSEPLHNIAVSGLSKLRADMANFKRAWVTALSTLSFFSAPAFAVLAVTGQDLTLILLGEKWAPAGFLLSIFGVRGIAQILERAHGWAHVAAGRSDRWMRWGLYSAVCQLVAVAAGLPFGVVGVCTSYTIAMFVLFVPSLVYSGRPIGIGSKDVLQAVGPQTIAALLAVAIAFIVQNAWLGELPPFTRVFLVAPVCLGTYVLVVVGLFRITAPIRLGLSILHDFMPRRVPGHP
jgi:PST family polysaccharide transporter